MNYSRDLPLLSSGRSHCPPLSTLLVSSLIDNSGCHLFFQVCFSRACSLLQVLTVEVKLSHWFFFFLFSVISVTIFGVFFFLTTVCFSCLLSAFIFIYFNLLGCVWKWVVFDIIKWCLLIFFCELTLEIQCDWRPVCLWKRERFLRTAALLIQ